MEPIICELVGIGRHKVSKTIEIYEVDEIIYELRKYLYSSQISISVAHGDSHAMVLAGMGQCGEVRLRNGYFFVSFFDRSVSLVPFPINLKTGRIEI